MKDMCNHKRCKRKRVLDVPYCRIHLTDQILSAALDKAQTPSAIVDLLPLPNISSAERMLIFLKYSEKFTAKEIGATLDYSEFTIRKMHHKLLDKLYPHLKAESEIIYPFSPDVKESHIISIREFSHELITYLAAHPNYLHNFDPRDFERLIAHILETLGFDVKLTAPTRDGGCDIIAFSVNDLGIQSKYIVECKRYRPDCRVGVRLVRSLYGVKDLYQAQHAVLATTSYFTRDAIAFAETPSVLALHLKDVNDITNWLNVCSMDNPRIPGTAIY